MKKLGSEIVFSILMFIIGICLLLWGQKLLDIITIVFGSLLILYGLYNLISALKNKSKDKNTLTIIYSLIVLVIGIVLVVKPNILSLVISFIVGIYIVISSIASLSLAINAKNSSNYKLQIGLSIVLLVIGILCIVGKFLVPGIILQFVGLMLIIYSIINIINRLMLSKEL